MKPTAEQQIDKLRVFHKKLQDENKDLPANTVEDVYMILAYGAGYSPNIIGYVICLGEQSIYRRMRKYPVRYEAAKQKREAKQKQADQKPE